MIRIGIDLGGTKTELVALGAGGDELFRKRVPTPRDYQGTLAAMVMLINEAESTLGQQGSVGVGIP
ncbi:MAG: ROK family protein, partial [Shewanella sp.]